MPIGKLNMQIPLQISFRNMDASEAVEADIRDKVGKLERLYDRITGCRVIVEAPHRHRHKGNLYDVRIDITVPGEEIVVQRSGPENRAHEDVYVAVRDAFNAATRRLRRARDIGRATGLRYVYEGNIPDAGGENTRCYRCGALLIEHYGFLANRIRDGRCPECETAIDGIGLSADERRPEARESS